MLTILIIVAAVAVGWFLRARVCSPSCGRGAYLWTPELERAAFDRGRRIGRDEEHALVTDRQRAILDGPEEVPSWAAR